MSTTAGLGLQEYKSINPLAVASVACAVLGLGAALHAVLLVLPLLGLLLGVIALWQISRSSGTQAGWLLAGLGILGSAAIGGYFATEEVAARQATAEHRQEVHETIVTFGEHLAERDFAAAYEMTIGGFREEVSLQRFGGLFVGLSRAVDEQGEPRIGWPTGAYTNDHAQIFTDATTGTVYADAMLIVTFERGLPHRQPARLVRTPQGWRFIRFDGWFPSRIEFLE